jgi:hypothetical protein
MIVVVSAEEQGKKPMLAIASGVELLYRCVPWIDITT